MARISTILLACLLLSATANTQQAGGSEPGSGRDPLPSTGSSKGACPLSFDFNANEIADPEDAQMVFESFLGIRTLPPEVLACGDFCADGSLNPSDAQGIFNTYLEIVPACD